jgi:hypothetical protein
MRPKRRSAMPRVNAWTSHKCRFDIDGLDMAPGRSVDVADGHLVECCGALTNTSQRP